MSINDWSQGQIHVIINLRTAQSNSKKIDKGAQSLVGIGKLYYFLDNLFIMLLHLVLNPKYLVEILM